MGKLMFVACQPKSSDDYVPTIFSEDETYHWDDSVSWGEGFLTREDAIEDYRKHHDEDEDDDEPTILTIDSEYDGLMDENSEDSVAIEYDEYARLCLEEVADELGDDNFVIFRHCPRGFANEMDFVAVAADKADEFRDEETYSEITKEEFIEECERGGENYAECKNHHTNPPCGAFRLRVSEKPKRRRT